MSQCTECGKEMDRIDAQENEICYVCRRTQHGRHRFRAAVRRLYPRHADPSGPVPDLPPEVVDMLESATDIELPDVIDPMDVVMEDGAWRRHRQIYDT